LCTRVDCQEYESKVHDNHGHSRSAVFQKSLFRKRDGRTLSLSLNRFPKRCSRGDVRVPNECFALCIGENGQACRCRCCHFAEKEILSACRFCRSYLEIGADTNFFRSIGVRSDISSHHHGTLMVGQPPHPKSLVSENGTAERSSFESFH